MYNGHILNRNQKPENENITQLRTIQGDCRMHDCYVPQFKILL